MNDRDPAPAPDLEQHDDAHQEHSHDEAAGPDDPSAIADARWTRRPLADFECEHGRLESDPPRAECDCWTAPPRRPILLAPILPAEAPSPSHELAADLRARIPFDETPLGRLQAEKGRTP